MGGFVNSISSRVTPGGAIIEEIQVPDLSVENIGSDGLTYISEQLTQSLRGLSFLTIR